MNSDQTFQEVLNSSCVNFILTQQKKAITKTSTGLLSQTSSVSSLKQIKTPNHELNQPLPHDIKLLKSSDLK